MIQPQYAQHNQVFEFLQLTHIANKNLVSLPMYHLHQPYYDARKRVYQFNFSKYNHCVQSKILKFSQKSHDRNYAKHIELLSKRSNLKIYEHSNKYSKKISIKSCNISQLVSDTLNNQHLEDNGKIDGHENNEGINKVMQNNGSCCTLSSYTLQNRPRTSTHDYYYNVSTKKNYFNSSIFTRNLSMTPLAPLNAFDGSLKDKSKSTIGDLEDRQNRKEIFSSADKTTQLYHGFLN